MFNFYNMFYDLGYLKIEDLQEACKWNCITAVEYKTITGQDYAAK